MEALADAKKERPIHRDRVAITVLLAALGWFAGLAPRTTHSPSLVRSMVSGVVFALLVLSAWHLCRVLIRAPRR